MQRLIFKVCLAALTAGILLGSPGVWAQEPLAAQQQGIDAPNLEPLIRVGGSSSTVQAIRNSPYGFSSTGGAVLSPVRGRVLMQMGSPVPGAALFLFQPPLPPESANPASPIIRRVWAGLGGHRVINGSGGSTGDTFPVICSLEAGSRAFNGWLRVPYTSGQQSLTWSTHVSLLPGQQATVELDGGSMTPGTPLKVELVSEDGLRAATSQSFTLDMDANSPIYWITPSVAGLSSLDSVLCITDPSPAELAPPASPMYGARSPEGRVVRRLEAIHPSLLPENPLAWEGARFMILGSHTEKTLSPQARTALLSWLASGGHLIVFPGSRLAPAGASPSSSLLSYSYGAGQVSLAPGSITDPDVRVTADFIRSALNSNHWWRPAPAGYVPPLGSALEPTISMPGWPVFLALGLGYILILGPLSLWLMRRVRRIVHVWLVVPAMASAFTLVILALGGRWTHALRTLNTSSVQVVSSGSPEGEIQSDVVFFTPDPGSITLDAGSQSAVSFISGSVNPNNPPQTIEDRGDRISSDTHSQLIMDLPVSHSLLLDHLPSFGERHFRTAGPLRLGGEGLQVLIHSNGAGFVRNGASMGVPAGKLVTNLYILSTPALAPGEKFTFDRSKWEKLSNLNPVSSNNYPGSGVATTNPRASYPGYPSGSGAELGSGLSALINPRASYPGYPSGYPASGYPGYPSGYMGNGYPGYPSGYPDSGYPGYPSSYPGSGYPTYSSGYIANYPGDTSGVGIPRPLLPPGVANWIIPGSPWGNITADQITHSTRTSTLYVFASGPLTDWSR